MSTTSLRPIEDAIVALTMQDAEFYGVPYFRWCTCEVNSMVAADSLAEELTRLGYEVVADDYTVSWEPPFNEYYLGSHPALRVRLATEKDLARHFGSSGLLIGFRVTANEPTPPPNEQPEPPQR